MTRAARACLVAIACVTACARIVSAQAPNEKWRTLSTEHFRITFPQSLESLARRTGGEAERAWTRLAAQLHPPRGPVDIVVADNQDVSNGQATYFPTNRIVIWAHPPIDDAALRFGDDWIQEVVTHELTHVFQLDRTRGWWRVAQTVFGRHPSLFPNARAPRWLTEGLAVAFESQHGSGGRLNGSELATTLDASAASGRPLVPSRLSLATPYWPAGNLAYFAGARVVAEAERARGDSAVRRFIERVASFPIPYLWDIQAKAAFGKSFGALAESAAPVRAMEFIEPVAIVSSEPFWDAQAPRWRGDTVYFTASSGREFPGLYAARGAAGAESITRMQRLNSTGPFSFGGGHTTSAQLDYTDAYRLYSSIYVDGARVRGTDRLSAPDARMDGMIVAVETAAGTARLVMLSRDGRRVRDMTAADPDVQWSAPRWSRRGDRIAAIRWRRGGESDVVTLDTLGTVLTSHARARAVQTHPSWDVDDRAIYFTSDRNGRSAPFRVRLDGANAGAVEQVARDAFGLHDAEVSHDGARIALFRITPDGEHLAIIRADGGATIASPSFTFAAGTGDSIVTARGAVRGYSPVRSLLPRYWIPTLGTSSRDNMLPGFHTSGLDIVGRYAFAMDGSWDAKTGEFYGDAGLTFRGLGAPVVAVALSQGWTIFNVATNDNPSIGEVARRSRTASTTLTWSRPRVRTGFAFTAGAELEWREFRVHPDSLALHLEPPLPDRTLRYPTILVAAAWSSAATPRLGVGPEDGVVISASARRRWRTSDPQGTAANSVIGTVRMFKALPFAGHAHHSVAVRGAAGVAGRNITSLFTAGGVSGTSLELVPGYSIGDAQRTFFVRGFPAGAVHGTRAWSATAEYRAPLMRVARGLWPFPFFWQRSALAVFGDAASAWCPVDVAPTLVCPAAGSPKTVLGSIGAELLFDATLDYDTPTRFRVGVAAPVHGRAEVRAKNFSAYFSLGLPF